MKNLTQTLMAIATVALLAGTVGANAADLTWSGGGGTWENGTTGSFDGTWNNTTPDSADFDGTAGTVTVDGGINIADLHFTTASGYVITGGALNFASGGTISNSSNLDNNTIQSTITGAPAVNIADAGVGNSYQGLEFAPTAGHTQTLGIVTNPVNGVGNVDKAGVTLGGSTTGNTVSSITYGGSDRYGTVWKEGTGTWTVDGDLETGTLRVSDGTLLLNGTATAGYQGHAYTGGTVGGNGTIKGVSANINSGATLAPGTSVGTLTASCDGPLQMLDGSNYEWEVGASTTDLIHLTDGELVVGNMTLKVLDAGGTPGASDQLPVFTYDEGVDVDLSGFADSFDTSALGDGWSFDSLDLADDGGGTVYLTGLAAVPEPASLMLLGLGGLGVMLRRRVRK